MSDLVELTAASVQQCVQPSTETVSGLGPGRSRAAASFTCTACAREPASSATAPAATRSSNSTTLSVRKWRDV